MLPGMRIRGISVHWIITFSRTIIAAGKISAQSIFRKAYTIAVCKSLNLSRFRNVLSAVSV